jgi:putative membrane protein
MHKLAYTLPALALLAACGSHTETNTVAAANGTVTEIATDTGNSVESGLDNASVAVPAMTGQQFADAAAASDAYEIAAGKLAQRRARPKTSGTSAR